MILDASGGPKKALRIYRKRWQIECLFGDTKTRGFNMEDTQLTQAAKLSLLLGLVALAWSMACASPIKGKQDILHASHAYRKSWFRTSFDTLRHWIIAQPDMAIQSSQQFWKRAGKPVRSRRVM